MQVDLYNGREIVGVKAETEELNTDIKTSQTRSATIMCYLT